MEKDDCELIEQAQHDQSQFGLIYLKYFKKLYTFIWYRVGKSASVAQDLAQETFLRAFKHLGRFQQRSVSYLAYLFKIARNLVISHYRKRTPLSLEEIPEPETISISIQEKLDAELALKDMETLNPLYREVLRMKYIDHLPIKTISAHFGKSENAVKLMLYRAKKAMRQKEKHRGGVSFV
jgi:RNA polymerase sigma-70 factor (ECF subfamily)